MLPVFSATLVRALMKSSGFVEGGVTSVHESLADSPLSPPPPPQAINPIANDIVNSAFLNTKACLVFMIFPYKIK